MESKKQGTPDGIAEAIINEVEKYELTITDAQGISNLVKEKLLQQPLQSMPRQIFVDGYLQREPSKVDMLEAATKEATNALHKALTFAVDPIVVILKQIEGKSQIDIAAELFTVKGC